MTAAPTQTAARLAALEGRLNGDAVPELRAFRDVDNALDALAEAVEALAFGGQDQRVRARDMLRAIHRELHSLQLAKEDA
jgi:two-component sensor histidine kinase